MRAAEVEVVIVELHLEELVAVVLEPRVVLLMHFQELTTWVAVVAVDQVATPHIGPAKTAVKVLLLLNGDSNNGSFCSTKRRKCDCECDCDCECECVSV
jgi:hypothetical protein